MIKKGMEIMDKIFNWISIIAAAIGGFLAKVLGGWDMLLVALVSLVILDYITGIIKAVYLKQLSSEIGYKGILKKIMMFMVVAAACVIGRLTGEFVPLREAVIIFFVANEGLSLCENIGEFIPLPEKLKSVLLQLREKTTVTKNESEGE